MDRKLLSAFGLKYNPFGPHVPVEGLCATPQIEHFAWRVDNLARDGGFALVTGDSGHGKSVALRLLRHRLSASTDLRVGVLSRPQSGVADFYRELGELFDVTLTPHNRWAGAKTLRRRWLAHIEQALYRPVLLVDEAQEMTDPTLTELRLLAADHLDAQMLLTVVLGGDLRLTHRFDSAALLPLGSRIRVRLNLTAATPAQLMDILQHLLAAAGNPTIMSDALKTTLCEHAMGNLRALAVMADELLAETISRQLDRLDEALFLDLYALPRPGKPRSTKPRKR